jgi:TatD DNase family protein
MRRIEPEGEAMTEPILSLADSHCHIDMPQFDEDRIAVLERARSAGVERLLVVGCADAEAGHRRALRVAGELGLPASAGVHPHDAKRADDMLLAEIAELGRSRAVVAIGEIGLDFYYDNSPRDEQREVFRRQVRLARQVGLPVIVHTRDADSETAEILEGEGAGEVGGVIHCFTGGDELARRALDLGFHISFSGIVTFPRAEGIREVARTMPLDRLLVETDAPFLAPVPHRGKRNEPAFVTEVLRKVAELRELDPGELGRATVTGFDRLFGSSERARPGRGRAPDPAPGRVGGV